MVEHVTLIKENVTNLMENRGECNQTEPNYKLKNDEVIAILMENLQTKEKNRTQSLTCKIEKERMK